MENHPSVNPEMFGRSGIFAGNCYKVAADLMLASRNKKFVLVHGLLEGKVMFDGLIIGHAWIEMGDVVIDEANGRKFYIEKEEYYRTRHVIHVRKYTLEEARTLKKRFGTYGPWDDDVKPPAQK